MITLELTREEALRIRSAIKMRRDDCLHDAAQARSRKYSTSLITFIIEERDIYANLIAKIDRAIEGK